MIERTNVAGEPLRVREYTLTTQAQIVRGQFPFGGLAWARPIAVVVERAGQSERVPIVDRTKMGLAFFTMLGAMGVTFARMRRAARK